MRIFAEQQSETRGDSQVVVSDGLCEHLRAMRLFLRARAVINFLTRAASIS